MLVTDLSPTDRSTDLYRDLMLHVRKQTDAVGRGEQISVRDTEPIAHRLLEEVTRSSGLLSTAMGYFDPLDFVVSHAANVAIYTLKMTLDMGLPERDIESAVIAAILHDVGFSRVPVYSRESEKIQMCLEDPLQALTGEDHQLVTRHPVYGHEAILPDDPRSELIADIILQHHEKADGSGYPNGLMESEQHAQARIISIIDTYEALVHPRPCRDALVPPQGIEAIKNQTRGAYSSDMIRALLNSFSVYPVGHFVRLSNGAIGKVVETHRENPLQPVVELRFDQKGDPIDPPRQLDLSEEQMLSVKECLPRFRPS